MTVHVALIVVLSLFLAFVVLAFLAACVAHQRQAAEDDEMRMVWAEVAPRADNPRTQLRKRPAGSARHPIFATRHPIFANRLRRMRLRPVKTGSCF